MTRLHAPQPFEEIDHTADLGVRVRGATAEEALARLVLAMGALLSGGGSLQESEELRLTTGPGELTFGAIDVLRELLFRFDDEHLIPSSVEVERFDHARGAALVVGLAPHDDQAHEEGTELKAVTLHQARFERDDDGFVAEILFDV
jgi:SHS2 domain-containing protein